MGLKATPAFWMITASFLFAILGALVKILHDLPLWEVVFFRSFISFVWFLPWAIKHPHLFSKSIWKADAIPLMIRSISGCLSMALYFYAIMHLNLGDAVMINYTSPIPTLVLSALFLKEKLSTLSIISILIAFIGVGLVLKPGLDVAHLAGVAAISSSFIASIAYVSMKVATRHLSSRFIVITFSGVSALISFIPMMFNFEMPDLSQWLILIISGIIASFAQLSMTKAFAGLPASIASPMSLLTVVFSCILGWMLWGEVPDQYSIIGGLFVLVGLIGAYRFRPRILI